MYFVRLALLGARLAIHPGSQSLHVFAVFSRDPNCQASFVGISAGRQALANEQEGRVCVFLEAIRAWLRRIFLS